MINAVYYRVRAHTDCQITNRDAFTFPQSHHADQSATVPNFGSRLDSCAVLSSSADHSLPRLCVPAPTSAFPLATGRLSITAHAGPFLSLCAGNASECR
ncbi:hypothetical protein L227DRAFT_64438 [Lentinus tigrinus ALCF2SS1-6]|uniref:Uncharacterized protein n=1 Tax=Lentinus tigrinus ALCF2SS1-6 TaxID=1328759 RepID=A0A5C2SC03_9APHY|nr:hypothetical protein L227DRAFT_64438 [Lentinus tigrinus ALCF2SS1-6]